jgi:DNA-binding response OmpR family regulator
MPALRQARSSERSNVPIYVVEDDADIARLVKHQLELNSYRIFATATSVLQEAALDLPWLFLLDMMLPGTNGFKLCGQIRRHPLLAKIPIIFMTAKAGKLDRLRGLDLAPTITSPNPSARGS